MSTTLTTETTKYLTFKLDEEVFALDISKVREVLNFITVTRVPKMPSFMCGVINLRGGAVPVIDLRTIFEMPEIEEREESCIIIVEVTLGEENIVLGAMVDSVQEVFELSNEKIDPAPKIGSRLNTDFIKGMGKRGEEFIIILDIDNVFSVDELLIAKETGNYTK